MKEFRGFAEILEDKIKKNLGAFPHPTGNDDKNSANVDKWRSENFGGRTEIDTDPAHLAYLISQINPAKNTISPLKSTYPKAKPIAKPAARKPHVLTAAQQKAKHFFTHWATVWATILPSDLGPAFTEKELKQQFWALAKRLHPDHSKGSGHDFIELKAAYKELQMLFKPRTASQK